MDETIPPTRVLDYESAIHRPSLARRLMRVLGFLLILALGAGIGMLIAWAIVPVHYVAETMLYIQFPNPGLATRTAILQSHVVALASPANLNTAMTIALRKGVAPQAWNQAVISTELIRQSDLIRITVQHPNADQAVLISNAVVEASGALFMSSGVDVQLLSQARSPGALLPQRDRRFLVGGAFLGAMIGLAVLLARRKRVP